MESSSVCCSQPDSSSACPINVGETERTVSAAAGGLVILYLLSKLSASTTFAAAAGAALIYRGLSGHCRAYQALGMSTACDSSPIPQSRRPLLRKGTPVGPPAAPTVAIRTGSSS